jgi:hypothetical protein
MILLELIFMEIPPMRPRKRLKSLLRRIILAVVFVSILWNLHQLVTGDKPIAYTDLIHISPDSATNIMKQEHPQKVVYFSRKRPDRAGACIMDMMTCHAWAFDHNATYGGACGASPSPHQEATEHLLKEIGLDQLVRFTTTCPPATGGVPPTSQDDETSTAATNIVLEKEVYLLTDQDILIWTPTWLNLIRTHVRYPASLTLPSIRRPDQSSLSSETQQQTMFTIAVHIRRGDVEPCCWGRRYLPNSHYQALIDRYAARHRQEEQNNRNLNSNGTLAHHRQKERYQVIVFSETQSFESWNHFRSKGYHLILDGDPADVWKTIMVSDVVILSKSSFSIVPAALNRHGTIVYTEMWHKPLPGWHVVDDNDPIMVQTKRERKRLRKTCSAKMLAYCDQQK